MDLRRFYHSFRLATMFNSKDRGAYIRKHHLFDACGDHLRISQMLLPLHADKISVGNNVEIASGVKLITHDAIHTVFKYSDPNIGEKHYPEHVGRITIGNNVFIGANALILGPVTIGDNCIIAAGAVVNKDIPSGKIAGGVPARVIGDFEELKKKRMGSK